MRKRLPVTTGGTEATRATVVIAALHVQSPERRAAPARPVGDHAEVVPGMPLAPVALPLLRVQVQKRGGDHLGVELGRREVLGGHAHLGGAVALRDAQGVVDERRRVDLHGDRIGVGRVEAIEVEDLLEVEEHPLDPPAGGIEVQRLLGAQAGGGQHIGEQLVPRAAAAPPDVAQQLPRGRGARASLHQPVLQAAALHAAAPQPLELVQAQPPVAPDQPPAVLRGEGGEEVRRPVQAIADDQGVRGEIGQGGQARAVEHHDGAEAGLHRRQLGGVARGHRRDQPGGEAAEDLGKERRAQIPTALKEGLGARHDPREARVAAFQRVDQGLTQRLGRPQDHRRPEPDQGLERPDPLPLGLPHRTEHRPTQRGGDVLLQQIDHPQQVHVLRAFGHSPSWRWGCYGSVNPTGCDSLASYLSGGVGKRTKKNTTPTDLRIRCYGCKVALVGTRPLDEVLRTPLLGEQHADPPLTEREVKEYRLRGYCRTLIEAHWREMMGPEDRTLHPLPRPAPGYEPVDVIEPLASRIDRVTDKTFTGRRYDDGTVYNAVVLPLPAPKTKKTPTPGPLQVVAVVASYWSPARARKRVVIERVFVGNVDAAVDLVMTYKLKTLAGPEGLMFGSFVLAPLPDPETAKVDCQLLIDHRGIVLPNLPAVKDGLLHGGPVGAAVEAVASITAKTSGMSGVVVVLRDHRSDDVKWGFTHKVKDAF